MRLLPSGYFLRMVVFSSVTQPSDLLYPALIACVMFDRGPDFLPGHQNSSRHALRDPALACVPAADYRVDVSTANRGHSVFVDQISRDLCEDVLILECELAEIVTRASRRVVRVPVLTHSALKQLQPSVAAVLGTCKQDSCVHRKTSVGFCQLWICRFAAVSIALSLE